MREINYLLAFTFLFLISACYYDVEEELYPGSYCETVDATYAAVVLPIIENACYGCHAAASNQGGVNLEGYTALETYLLDGSFECSINWEGGCSPMPKNASQLNACDLKTINQWLDNGALNN